MKRKACLLILLLCAIAMPGLYAQQPVKTVRKPAVKIDAATFARLNTQYEQLQRDLKELEFQRAQISRLAKEYSERLVKVQSNMDKLEKEYDEQQQEPDAKEEDLMKATKQLNELQAVFNIQYQQLQSQLLQETRAYAAISAILKTKHDTAKGSIRNMK